MTATTVDGPVAPVAHRTPGRPRDERASSAITDAALRQLDEIGYGRITMESVACEAGVARATVYRRYRDKADLITAALAGNSTGHLVEGPSDDPRADLIAFSGLIGNIEETQRLHGCGACNCNACSRRPP